MGELLGAAGLIASASPFAGHCASLNEAVWSPGNGVSMGSITNRAPFPSRDLELIGLKTYSKSIYVGNTVGTLKAVGGAADPNLTFTNYCYSGIISAERCGNDVNDLSADFCDPAGCTLNVVAFTGPVMAQTGDSGSPFYVSSTTASIRGMLFAKAGNQMYAEKWSVIANALGVTIRT